VIVRFASGLRKAGLTVGQFQEHWRTLHADAVLALDGLEAYVQNHLILRADGTPWLPWPTTDACAEIEFRSIEEMDAAFSSPAADAVRADSAHMIEPGRGGLTICERRLLAGDGWSPDEGVKLVTALRRFPACDPDAFAATLGGAYAEEVATAAPLRHEQLVPIRDEAANAGAFCELVDLLWFPDAETAAAFAVSETMGRAAAVLTGVAFGVERLVARPVRVR